MNEPDRTDGTNRFDGASVPKPRTDETRHVTLESLLARIDEALAAIASLDVDDSLQIKGAEPPEPDLRGR